MQTIRSMQALGRMASAALNSRSPSQFFGDSHESFMDHDDNENDIVVSYYRNHVAKSEA